MGSVLNKNSMRISRNPEFFVSGLIKPGKNKPPGIADLSFFDQITGKYGHTAGFIKTQLHYLYFPKQIKFLQKNLLINFFIHSHFNIFPAIVKNISCLHRNFIENRQEDIFLAKISNLLKAPTGLNLSSQPVLRFQNIAICAVKKLLKINRESAKVQKHEIRPGNQVANIFFRDTSFFTYPRLNPISNRADRNIVEKKSKSMKNFVASKATESEKKYISISHPSRRPSLVNFYLQNSRNRITIPQVLLNLPVCGHIFAKQSAAGRQPWSYLTEFPMTIASRRREIFNLYDNVTNERQSNISKETIARPISLIPFDKTAALIADFPPLPAVFSKLPVMRENPLLEAKDADSHPKKRTIKQPIESDTAHLNNIMKSINFDKKLINRLRYIPFSDYDFTYMIKQRRMLRKSGSVKKINNPPSPVESILTQEPSMAGYRNNFPDMTYFSSNRSPHSTDMAGSGEGKKKTEFLKVDSSYKTDHTKPLSVPWPDLYGLADKVYGLIVERIKRECELRGR